MKKAFFLGVIIAVVTVSAAGRRVRVKHKIDSRKSSLEIVMAVEAKLSHMTPDSIGWKDAADKISFYGFDKTVNSNKESLFVVNGLDSCDVVGMTLDVTYLDMKGRQLHRRDVERDCDIPSGETRRIDFPTWDTQKAFYYHKSSAPKKQATPFNVKVSLKSLRITNY